MEGITDLVKAAKDNLPGLKNTGDAQGQIVTLTAEQARTLANGQYILQLINMFAIERSPIYLSTGLLIQGLTPASMYVDPALWLNALLSDKGTRFEEAPATVDYDSTGVISGSGGTTDLNTALSVGSVATPFLGVMLSCIQKDQIVGSTMISYTDTAGLADFSVSIPGVYACVVIPSIRKVSTLVMTTTNTFTVNNAFTTVVTSAFNTAATNECVFDPAGTVSGLLSGNNVQVWVKGLGISAQNYASIWASLLSGDIAGAIDGWIAEEANTALGKLKTLAQ